MPTSNEKKALWFFALVALSGSGVRLCRARAPAATVAEAVALDAQIERVDSVRGLRRRDRGSAPGRVADTPVAVAPLDLDRATADQIEALPGIGPALSQRIVAARDSLGAFGEIDALCAVVGVGPALVKKLRPLVTFTGPRRPLIDTCREARNRPRARHGTRPPEPR